MGRCGVWIRTIRFFVVVGRKRKRGNPKQDWMESSKQLRGKKITWNLGRDVQKARNIEGSS